MTLRWTRFLTVGVGGFLVQAGALAVICDERETAAALLPELRRILGR